VDEQSCASTEEEVTCAGKRGTEIQKLVGGCFRETGSWFQRQGEAYRKERSVIRSKDMVDWWSIESDEMKGECCEEAQQWWGYADMNAGWL